MVQGKCDGRCLGGRSPHIGCLNARKRASHAERVMFDRGCVEAPAVEASPSLSGLGIWEWRALYENGADAVSMPGDLARVAADLAAHLPGLARAPGFRCASLSRVLQ